MKSEHGMAFEICNKLLDVLEKEKKEIAESNIDRIEHYCSVKMGLLQELDEFNKKEAGSGAPGVKTELEALLKKIISLNETNTEAVRLMKKNVINEISTGHKQKKAFKAYNK